MSVTIAIIITVAAFITGIAVQFAYRKLVVNKRQEANERKAESVLDEAKKEAERLIMKSELKAKEVVEKKSSHLDRLISQKQKEFSRIEQRLQSREGVIDKKYESYDKKLIKVEKMEKELDEQKSELDTKQDELDAMIEQAKIKIEEIAEMSRESAKQELVNIVENEAKHESARRLKEIEEELNKTAEEKAKNVISLAMQRYAGSYSGEKTVSVVALPSDDMKGRVIGREGRNIRSLELQTGVDLIIDDTPETVVVSSLNPIRRDIAKKSLEKLIQDGHIHPARIEEIVKEVEEEVEKEIQKAGEEAVFDLGISNMHPELIHYVGRLKYRTSYSQNILSHSIEVGFICGMLASEIGFDTKLARRAGLLHDIGKSVDHEFQGSHIDIGIDLVKKYGEPEAVIDACAKSHDPQPQGVLPLLVQAADAISAARPGARRESYEAYINRIQGIEEIANSFHGVEKCYAIQAGREVRVMVQNSNVNDDEAAMLSHEIAKKIEKEVVYPGRVKVTVIREVRSVAYAS